MLLRLLLFELCLQQGAQVGRTRSVLVHAIQSFTSFAGVLSLDGQLDAAVLTVDADDLSRNRVTFSQLRRSVFNAIGGDFRSAQVAFRFIAQVDD